MELLGHKTVQLLIFWGTFMLFSIVVIPIYIPTNSTQEFAFISSLSNPCYFLTFDTSPSNRCEVIFHCGLNCICLVSSATEHLFHVSIICVCIFFRKMSIQVLCPVYSIEFIFFYWVVWVANIFLTLNLLL